MLGHWSYQLTMNTYSQLNSEAARLMAGALWDSDETAGVRADRSAAT